MENKTIIEIKFDTPRKAELEVLGGKIIISGVSFEDYHDQGCCEDVYADFSVMDYYKSQIEELKEISKIEVKSVEDMGFIIFLYKEEYGGGHRFGILINCYNEQNGYYSDDLELIIKNRDELVGKFEIDKYDKIN